MRALWDRVWFARCDPLPAGVFRILLGTLLFVSLVAAGPNWERFYARDGMISLDQVRQVENTWCVFHWTEGVWPVRVYWWIGLAAAACFTAGLFTRTATIVLYVLQSSMVVRNLGAVNGEDQLFRMLLFYGCFAPLGAAVSVDRWRARRRGRDAPPEPRVWAVRLIQVNLACIYLFSLPDKLLTDTIWRNGHAIYYCVVNNHWGRWPWPEMFYGGVVSRIFSYGTLLVEGAFPLLVWFRRTRVAAVAAAMVLHLGIAVMIANATFFTLGMFCALWIFLPAGTLRALAARVRRTPAADAA